MERNLIIEKTHNFINEKITEIATNNSLINIARPIINRMVNNIVHKGDNFLKLLEDENGNIDIDTIIKEITDSLIVSTVNYYPDLFGGIEIGAGKISMHIPIIDKRLVIDSNDIKAFRQYLAKP